MTLSQFFQKHKPKLAYLLTAALLFGMLSGGLTGRAKAAESSSELSNQLDKLQDQNAEITAQIEELRSQLADNLDRIEAIVAQKNLIDQEIFLLYQQLDNINSQISTYGLLIADKQEELDAAQIRLSELQEQNKTRIRAMEKNGKLSYWSVLFKAHSFTDLLDRLKMVQEIAEADRLRLEEMTQAARAVAQAKSVLETEKAALQSTKDQLDATQLELENKRAEADSLLAALLAEGEEFESLLNQSEQQQSDLMEQIAQKEKDIENAKYQEWLATSVPETTKPPATQPTKPPEPQPTIPPDNGSSGDNGNTGSSATWVVPINYTMLSSPFGYRYHPLDGQWRMHYGVDLAAPTGTPIYASRSGMVTTAAYEAGGAGYYVSINHGDGYASIYMHMTHFIVSPGQYVTAGEVIGYCGSTGGSTGPHLHFGISYQGVYVNPADYIPI